MSRFKLKGTERSAMPGARATAPADPGERFEVSVLVRRRAPADLTLRAAAMGHGGRARKFLSREEFSQAHGADPADFAAVARFAAGHGLAVVQEHAGRRTVVLSGTVAQFSAAFDVELQHMTHAGGTYRGRTGAITLPQELDGIVEAVLGLDNRPQAKPHFRRRPAAAPNGHAVAGNGAALNAAASVAKDGAVPDADTSFTPLEVANLYRFPAASGQGQCIGIIELGGGYVPADLDTYFQGLNAATPNVIAVSVDHGTNSPTGDGSGPDGEVMLDIEVAGAVAPQARIAVYFAPNTDAGFLDAITSAIHDTANSPTVISISWGGPESSWTGQSLTAMDSAFQAAATMGITVCCASGDNGSSDGAVGDNVDFPASSGFVLACGGTQLKATQADITAETTWNDGASGGATGGGVSTVFALPAWQKGLSANKSGQSVPLAMRGVPDVAGDADPASGYQVRVDGSDAVIGGTSAVAPLWAGLIARINSLNGSPAGFINPQLYANTGALRDITVGNNGDFAAALGWDACTGLGSPIGTALAGIL